MFRAETPIGLVNAAKKKGQPLELALRRDGRAYKIRTCDQRIKSPLLYQLS